jgi:hypothetical protein
MSEVRLQVCGCLWKDLSGERQLALTQQQKEKRRREAGGGCYGGERKQDLGKRSCFGDVVGVIVEVLVEWCGRGWWYYQEKEFQAGGVEVRIGWVMGLWGPGEGWSDPRDADGRACVQVEAEVEPTVNAVACRSLSCTSKGENKVQGMRGGQRQADKPSRPWKLAVEALKQSTKAATRR